MRVFILLVVLFLFSCKKEEQNIGQQFDPQDIKLNGFSLVHMVEIDSCEYIVAEKRWGDGGASITHHNNCKFCAQRKCK